MMRLRSGAALRTLEAHRLVRLASLQVMPALIAGLLVYARLGRPGIALVVAACMIAALRLPARVVLPLGLMPVTRLVLGLLTPVLGTAIAFGLCYAAGKPIPAGGLLDATI